MIGIISKIWLASGRKHLLEKDFLCGHDFSDMVISSSAACTLTPGSPYKHVMVGKGCLDTHRTSTTSINHFDAGAVGVASHTWGVAKPCITPMNENRFPYLSLWRSLATLM